MYQRNDRWQARNFNGQNQHGVPQNPPISIQRGPLPDWDEVAEAAQDGGFDYMDLMESQYSQFCAMMAMPPFDPNMGVKGTPLPSYMVPFMPPGVSGQLFRAPVVVPTGLPQQQADGHQGLQAAAQAAIEKRDRCQQHANSVPTPPAPLDVRTDPVACAMQPPPHVLPKQNMVQRPRPPNMLPSPRLPTLFTAFPRPMPLTVPIMSEVRDEDVKAALKKQM